MSLLMDRAPTGLELRKDLLRAIRMACLRIADLRSGLDGFGNRLLSHRFRVFTQVAARTCLFIPDVPFSNSDHLTASSEHDLMKLIVCLCDVIRVDGQFSQYDQARKCLGFRG